MLSNACRVSGVFLFFLRCFKAFNFHTTFMNLSLYFAYERAGHIARKWQKKDSNPDVLAPESEHGTSFLLFASKIYSFCTPPTPPLTCPVLPGLCSQVLGSGVQLDTCHVTSLWAMLECSSSFQGVSLVTRPRPRGGSRKGQGLISGSATYVMGALNKRLTSLFLIGVMKAFGTMCKGPDME